MTAFVLSEGRPRDLSTVARPDGGVALVSPREDFLITLRAFHFRRPRVVREELKWRRASRHAFFVSCQISDCERIIDDHLTREHVKRFVADSCEL